MAVRFLAVGHRGITPGKRFEVITAAGASGCVIATAIQAQDVEERRPALGKKFAATVKSYA